METTLHRQLKTLYGIDDAEREVRLGKYRIDAVVDDLLIEVQVASLAAIRRKIADLVQKHRVLVVKPVVVRSYIVRQSLIGSILGSRYSPKTHHACELFDEFVHFAKTFPHPNLSVEFLFIEQEEHRIPRRGRWRRCNYKLTDRKLRSVIERHRVQSPQDLLRYLPDDLPSSFTTAELAKAAGIPRWLAQKMAYVLRNTGAVEVVGKQKNSIVYQRLRNRQRAA